MAQYVVNTKTFIAPHILEPGTLINYEGPPGPHLDPVDDAAKSAVNKYYTDNPHARLNPVDALPTYGVEVLAPPVPVASALDVGILGNPGEASKEVRPGPDDSVAKTVAAAQAAAAGGGTSALDALKGQVK